MKLSGGTGSVLDAAIFRSFGDFEQDVHVPRCRQLALQRLEQLGAEAFVTHQVLVFHDQRERGVRFDVALDPNGVLAPGRYLP